MRINSDIKRTALMLIASVVVVFSCSEKKEEYLFQKVSSKKSGIYFSNDIVETPELNVLKFHYIYNGGGVGIGDFDKDGFSDIVFSGNQVASKLYLNRGDFNFEDISDAANFKTSGWATGVSIVDLNQDGWPDIYISVGGNNCQDDCFNQLFIHQGLDENGIPTFKEMAKDYGLEDGLYTQQAAFFDYDADGDLDVYLLHNLTDERDKNAPSEKRFINEKSKDQLYENIGANKFVNRSDSLGIIYRGYGLGIAINDFNNDLLPDIYVANDFLSDDLLYLNNGIENGIHQGFSEVSKQVLKHSSYNAMGVDVADVNEDGRPDIMTLDMLPEYNERQKTMLGFMNYNKFKMTLRQGYHPQFVRNTLQIHNGDSNGELVPFSEVAYLSGIHQTDWSWAPLLADFDNDGDRDLFVSNGYGKDITDLDFVSYTNRAAPFGTKETLQKRLFEEVQKMESISMPNYLYENKGELVFENKFNKWIKKENSISNGAAYADLDNDGDLDLVVNNLNEVAYIYKNELQKKSENNFIKIKTINPLGEYADVSVSIWTANKKQTQYLSTTRGYLSSVENIIHFGLGNHTSIDSILLKFITKNNTGNIQTNLIRKYNVSANQTLEVSINKDQAIAETSNKYNFQKNIFEKEVNNPFDYIHQENNFNDFDGQPLLLNQLSRQSPALLSADVNRKIGEEIFIGGAKGFPGQLFFENSNGSVNNQTLPDENCEDVAAVFFDAENDGDLDLYVVSGGVEYKADDPSLEDRIYLNDGKGQFSKSQIALPRSSGSCVAAADFDKDGDVDLFVGGRVQPRKYPYAPESFLLVNNSDNGKPAFDQILMEELGMVTDAVWSDINGDGWEDLLVVGEWMPITVFINQEGKLIKSNSSSLEKTEGFWNSIVAADFDNDGDDDYILGNQGNNSRMKASAEKPLVVYQKDFDNNGSPDPLIGQYFVNKKGEEKLYPLHARDDVMRQLPKLKNKVLKYADFGNTTLKDLLGVKVNEADFLFAYQLQSSLLINKDNGLFNLLPLPQSAQLAPVKDILAEDFDGDGNTDALLVGNDYTGEKTYGWHDAFNGLLLKGDGKGGFTPVATEESGFVVSGDARKIIKTTDAQGQTKILVAQNSDQLLSFLWKDKFLALNDSTKRMK